jgi:membrane fusion protein (multidrug efflux system)
MQGDWHREADEIVLDRKQAPAALPPRRSGRLRRALVGTALVALGLGVIAGGAEWWLAARHFESTDDAFIDADQSQIAAQISGKVVELLVGDNQHVEAGQVLLTIDPRDYQVRLEQVRAQQANAAAQAEEARAQKLLQQAQLAQEEAQVRVAEADQEQASRDLARYRAIDPAAITRQQLDQSVAAAKSAVARLDSARQAVLGGQAQIETQQAKIDAADAGLRQADADVHNAELQLSYTKVAAPQAGRVTRRTVSLGNYLSPGQAVLAIVPDEMWVTANFKETQLTHMRSGQPVEITVDAFPDQVLHGHVDSIQRGTGAVFSSLPAENATGNYVKVVQRVPVKVEFDGDAWRKLPLAPGLSVTPVVTVR